MKGGLPVQKFLAGLYKDERGLSHILVSVGVMALFGMMALVSDFGRIALARQQLVNAVDSAALAGAKELTFNPDPAFRENAARQTAFEVAMANGAPSGGIEVNFDGMKISVDAERTVQLIMSRAFGVGSRNVRARAAAVVTGISSYRGVAPLSIKEQPLTYGQLCTLKYGSPDSPGNFGALALGGTGGSTYKNNLINGFSQVVSVGDQLKTEPGNMSGPTEGIDQRLARCTDGCTYNNFKPGCPRVLVIPMHRDILKGRDTITVTGFAAFFVDRDATVDGSDEIKGYFVRMAAEGTHALNQPITGLYGAALVE